MLGQNVACLLCTFVIMDYAKKEVIGQTTLFSVIVV